MCWYSMPIPTVRGAAGTAHAKLSIRSIGHQLIPSWGRDTRLWNPATRVTPAFQAGPRTRASRSALGNAGTRSIGLCGLGCLSGSVREAPLLARASTTSMHSSKPCWPDARECHSEPRICLRPIAPRGTRLDVAVIESLPIATKSRPHASIDGRAATGSCLPGSWYARRFRYWVVWNISINLRRKRCASGYAARAIVTWMLPAPQLGGGPSRSSAACRPRLLPRCSVPSIAHDSCGQPSGRRLWARDFPGRPSSVPFSRAATRPRNCG